MRGSGSRERQWKQGEADQGSTIYLLRTSILSHMIEKMQKAAGTRISFVLHHGNCTLAKPPKTVIEVEKGERIRKKLQRHMSQR